MMRFLLSAVIVAAFILSGIAYAQNPNPLIEEGIQQYNELEYENSINTLSAALIRPGNSNEQKIIIYQYLGLNYLILGREAEAEGAFRSLLAIDEDWSFDPAATPPKFLDFFEKVEEKWIAYGKPGLEKAQIVEKPVAIRHKIPDEGVKKQEINLKIELENPKNIPVEIILFYKSASARKYKSVLGSLKGYAKETTCAVYMAAIPAEDVMPPSVDYYIHVTDAEGELLNSKGDESVPLRIPIPEGDKKKKKLLWGLLGGLGGAAVVGLVLGIALPLALKKDNGQPPDDPQNAQVTVFVCEEGTPGC